MRNLGQIRPVPPTNRWIWPFKMMEIGDSFTVDPDERPIGEVRNIAYVTANRHKGMKLSVTTDDDGMIRVERVDPEMMASRQRAHALDWTGMMRKLTPHYEEEALSTIPWEGMDNVGDFFVLRCVRRGMPERTEFIGEMHNGWKYHVQLFWDGLRVTRVPDHMTHADLVQLNSVMS